MKSNKGRNVPNKEVIHSSQLHPLTRPLTWASNLLVVLDFMRPGKKAAPRGYAVG